MMQDSELMYRHKQLGPIPVECKYTARSVRDLADLQYM
jgi:hypothetical protein